MTNSSIHMTKDRGMKISDGNGNTIVLPWQALIYLVVVLLALGGDLTMLTITRNDVASLKVSNEAVLVTNATIIANQNALKDRVAALERKHNKEN